MDLDPVRLEVVRRVVLVLLAWAAVELVALLRRRRLVRGQP